MINSGRADLTDVLTAMFPGQKFGVSGPGLPETEDEYWRLLVSWGGDYEPPPWAAVSERIAALLAELAVPTQSDYAAAIQSHIDEIAKARGYADGYALAGYATSTIPQWASEAQKFIGWRDQVWLTAYKTLAAVQSGTLAPPTVDALIAGLPAFEAI